MNRFSERAVARVFHAICRDPKKEFFGNADLDQTFAAAAASDQRWLSRLPDDLRFEGASVLDFGCGVGSMTVLSAERGAQRVLGVDIQELDTKQEKIRRDYPELVDRIELRRVTPGEELGDERFDLVLSKNSFEHVEDPRGSVEAMKRQLAPEGQLVIGFGPLWKAPWGGHINGMTRLPWAHLIFPEQVILRERRRYRPNEDPQRFEDFVGGLNRMTLARFRSIMAESGLDCTYWRLNQHQHPAVKAAKVLSRMPGLEEYFAFSVHSVWQLPAAALSDG